MALERNLIGNHGHNCRILDSAASAIRLREKSSNETERITPKEKGLRPRVN
jgi:hypothetical protein